MSDKDVPLVFPGMISVGLTLREYFAAAALSGAMANSRLDENLTIEMIVEDCWKAADAMMEARKK